MGKPKVAIIGHGNVGSALERGLKRAGYTVRATGKDATAVRETASWAEAIILAVPFGEIDATVRELGDAADGKPVVDVTNALGPNGELALGFTTSGAEELQKKLPQARVVKGFNTVFAQHMDSGRVKDQRLTAFLAGNDAEAKRVVSELAKDIGFDPVDAGPLENARWIESLGYLNIQLGYKLKMGHEIGFELVH